MSARESLHSDLLHTSLAKSLPEPSMWANARIDRYRAEVRAEVLAEAKAEVIAWLVKKAREKTMQDAGVLASKVDRGAVRIFLGTGHFRDAMDAHRAEVLHEAADKVGARCEEHGVLGVGALLRRMADETAGSEEKTTPNAGAAVTPQPLCQCGHDEEAHKHLQSYGGVGCLLCPVVYGDSAWRHAYTPVAVSVEKTTPLVGAAVTPQPDFFQPCHNYTAGPYTFRCDAITTHPLTGERRALGWFSRNGAFLDGHALDPDDYRLGGWTDTTTRKDGA